MWEALFCEQLFFILFKGKLKHTQKKITYSDTKTTHQKEETK